MDEILLENYRCFRERQSARVAPLTLLVGENSTGKTSFMALIRALWDIAHREQIPDFGEDPYDLGTFEEISHYRGGSGGRAKSFAAGFTITQKHVGKGAQRTYKFEVKFGKNGAMPIPVRRCVTEVGTRQIWAEIVMNKSSHNFRFQVSKDRSWKYSLPINYYGKLDTRDDLPPFEHFMRRLRFPRIVERAEKEVAACPLFEDADWREGRNLLAPFGRMSGRRHFLERPYASAPVRSKPKRTYDPSRPTADPQGDYVPMYFSDMHFVQESNWNKLRTSLERFGQQSGLFDEISVKPLGKSESGPFQLQIRKFGRKLKGPGRNLVDVGYGVSQVLPVITELLRPHGPPMFLLQQPEVHLHPSAQAALGSLLCQVADGHRQLIIETHSDHLLDRVRMDIRDQVTKLRPQDVSILYFEPGDLEVRIHSLALDQEGNVLGTPDGYRRFFLEETERSIWKQHKRGG